MAAWNQGIYQYFRMYGRMTSQIISTTPYDARWARAVLVLDSSGTWGGNPTDNFGETQEPEQDIPGVANLTKTIGFKVGINVELGKPPLTVGGAADATYIGTLTTSSEAWHPMVYPEPASGGVQYCNYWAPGNYSRKVTARVSLRQAENATTGFWYLGDIQTTTNIGCPGL